MKDWMKDCEPDAKDNDVAFHNLPAVLDSVGAAVSEMYKVSAPAVLSTTIPRAQNVPVIPSCDGVTVVMVAPASKDG